MDIATALRVRNQTTAPPMRQMLGTVLAASSTTLVVRVGAEVLVVPSPRHYTDVYIGDIVLLSKAGRSILCLGAYNADAYVPPPVPSPDPVPPSDGSGTAATGDTPAPRAVARTATFRPLSTGTFRGGWRDDTTDLYQGDGTGAGMNFGAAYFGNGPSGLVGTGVGATVRVRRIASGDPDAHAFTLRLLAELVRPAGAPTVADEVAGPSLLIGETATVTLPIDWAVALVDGDAGGIGIGIATATPYIALAGKAAWAPAFELTLDWSE